jgi:tagaturonate epimerase
MKTIGKYSIGVGDRFGHQAKAQLSAIMAACVKYQVEITPVWNKSNREHSIIGTTPDQVRVEADKAVADLDWNKPYFVDADHINFKNVSPFIAPSDFFTIDIADFIGISAASEQIDEFISQNRSEIGNLEIPGISTSFPITEEWLSDFAKKYLLALEEAGKLYHYLVSEKGENNLIAEVSCDETDIPQSPIELYFILKVLAKQGVKAQTIAPRFSGRFNKGVEYVGDLAKFAEEFEQDLCVIDYAIEQFKLPENLKLSVHSGSDKFSIYPIMGRLLKKRDKGIHIKTAGTTWLEEVAGLAFSGGEGLEIAKEIYCGAYQKIDELTAPYSSVIDISKERLPKPEEVKNWDNIRFFETISHNQECSNYNPDFRQLVHVGYKMAVLMGSRFYDALDFYAENIHKHVVENILERHLKRLFEVD